MVVFVFLAELNRAGLDAGDTENVISYLHRELLEAQDLANTGKQKCLELQGRFPLTDQTAVFWLFML